MSDVPVFGVVILVVAVAVLAAILSNHVSERVRVPAPVLFLLAAAAASEVVPRLGTLSVITDERVVTVALIFILFDGGVQIGWREFRASAGAILWLGVMGTAVTAGAVALVAHALFGFDWHLALLLGAALAPTDPAMVFSVLGGREITGRAGTILKGESGANDPVGIALMAVLLEAGGSGFSSVAHGMATFALQMVVGCAVGVIGGLLLVQFVRHVPLPNESLYPVRALAGAAFIYGVADVLSGSGFLAVLLAGVLLGDARAPYKHDIERFASGLSSLAEIVAFTILGLTIDLHDVFSGTVLWVGLGITALLVLIIRPLLVGVMMLRMNLERGEKAFILGAGLKGAVPILLGLFALGEGGPGTHRLYLVVFVVVLTSALLQGSLVPAMANWFKVSMNVVALEPWSLGLRFRAEPTGLQFHVVAAGSAADGVEIRHLAVGDETWVSLVRRNGELVEIHGGTELRGGDEVLIIGGTDVNGLFGPSSKAGDHPAP
ncbi:cation:proton antiporter [Nocardioides marmorisolisilvae]|uniref:Sodium:proton exchanger n=1 Tax=Nocardioides marmorisolisilvae TaxID=1542737 RepID=A0A3N0DX78_9ACTN|nr:cation:proton antiporter [Nocardioides marmorisolisilvae]RNL80220.1 sodium:proton exchanger [Nocardioides marmorisolisilvae]